MAFDAAGIERMRARVQNRVGTLETGTESTDVGSFGGIGGDIDGNLITDTFDAIVELKEQRTLNDFLNEDYDINQQYEEAGIENNGIQTTRDEVEESDEKLDFAKGKALAVPVRPAARWLMEQEGNEKGMLAPLAHSLRKTSASFNYWLTDEQKLAQARKIEQEMGGAIQAQTILHDADAYKNAMNLYDELQKKKQLLAGADSDDSPMDKIYAAHPELEKLAGLDPAGAALALKDMPSLNRQKDIIKEAMDAYSLGDKILKRNLYYYEQQNGNLTEEDKKKLAQLEIEIGNAQEKAAETDIFNEPLEALVEGGMNSLPLMLHSIGNGLKWGLAGAGAGALFGGPIGAAVGFRTGFTGGNYIAMYEAEKGEEWHDLKNLKDKNGKPILSDNEVQVASTVGSGINAAIEMIPVSMALRQYTRPLTQGLVRAAGSKAIGRYIATQMERKVVQSAVEKAALESSIAAMGAKDAAKYGLKEGAKDYALETASEMGEEGMQQLVKDLQMNLVAAYTGSRDVETYSAEEMISRASSASAQALPGALGLGVIGFAGGTVTNPLGVQLGKTRLVQERMKHFADDQTTYSGVIMLEKLQQNAAESKLSETAPDVQRKLMREELADTPYQLVYIDTESAMKKENGREDLIKAGKAAGMTEEEVQETIDNNGQLIVPTESYAQSEASTDLLESVVFNAEATPMAKMKEAAQQQITALNEATQQEIKQKIETVDAIIDTEFPTEGKEKDLARFLVYLHDGNPAEGWKEERKAAEGRLEEILTPALNALRAGMGQGVDIIQGEDGRGTRVSNNAEWYRKFYKENGKKPTEKQLRDMARALTLGEADAPKVEGWMPSNADEQAAMEALRPEIEELEERIETLDKIKDRLGKLTEAEMEMTSGLTREGYSVYRKVQSYMLRGTPKERDAAKATAILWAKHADQVAEIMRKHGNENYTAEDYLKTVAFEVDGKTYGLSDGTQETLGGFNQQEVENQKAEVRKKYEGTDQWMKAPNGKPTKLTEDQWLTVRTEAFKTFFGDWENNPGNASKVVDENGEPLPVYHGTKRGLLDGKIEVFDGKGRPIWHAESKEYAKLYFSSKKWYERGDVYDDFLNIRNPINVGDVGFGGTGSVNWLAEILGVPFEEVAEMFGITETDKKKASLPHLYIYEAVHSPEFVKWAKNKGYDGIIEIEPGKNKTFGAFEPSQVKSATKNNGNFDVNDPNRYHQFAGENAATADEKLKRDEEKWKETIGKYFDGEIKPTEDYRMMDTPLVLQLVGADALPININGSKFEHILEGHGDSVDREILEQIPRQLTDPVMIFRSYANRIVVLLKLEGKNNANIIVPIELNKQQAHFTANIIINAYGKNIREKNKDGKWIEKEGTDFEWIDNNIKNGRVLYINKIKSAHLLESEGSDSPSRANLMSTFSTFIISDAMKNVKTEEDLAALKAKPGMQSFYQSAWHGSPHVFDEFDLGAIGTGEGGQAHGWGLYFAADRKVSEGYKDRLSNGVRINGDIYRLTRYSAEPIVEKNGTEHITDKALHYAVQTLENEGSYEKAIVKLTEKSKSSLKGIAARAKESLELLQNLSPENVSVNEGTLFEVDVPEDEVLLDEDKPLSEQPQKVREAIASYMNSRPDSYIETDADSLGGWSGKTFYKDVCLQMRREGAEGDGAKEASQLLNEYGIKGITYEGRRDGRCYVVFDDKAISIINTYNQGKLGQMDILSNGQRLVRFFNAADQSTGLHEASHVWLDDLERLAAIDEDAKKQLEIINEWAEYSKENAKEYKGTPWVREFNKLAREIEYAKEHGFVTREITETQADGTKVKREIQVPLESLLKTWRHERFARGFEMYLKTGQAPAKGLKRIFKQFRDWLVSIYNAFVGDGGKASPAVEAVMARMIASEEQIKQVSLEDNYVDIEKAGGEKLFNESERETYERWQKEAHDEAVAKVTASIEKDYQEKGKEEDAKAMEAERERARASLMKRPVYAAREAVKLSGNESAALVWMPTIEAYREADKNTPDIDRVLEHHMEEYRKQLEAQRIKRHLTPDEVNRILGTIEYHQKVVELEAAALRRKVSSIRNISDKSQRALADVQERIEALRDDAEIQMERHSHMDVKGLMSAINKLRMSNKWNIEELNAIDALARNNTKAEVQEAVKALAQQLNTEERNKQAIMDAEKGKTKLYREMAKAAMKNKKLAEATAVATYRAHEREAARRTAILIKGKHWELAMRQKETQILAAAMTKEAEKQREWMNKLKARIERQLKSKVKMPADERYWHQKIAYMLRLTSDEPEKPAQLKTLQELSRELTEGLDVVENEESGQTPLDTIMELWENNREKGYLEMTMDEFEAAVEALDILYVTGRDKFKMKTIPGYTVREACDEIIQNISAPVKSVQKKVVERDTGGMGWNETAAKIPLIGEWLAGGGQNYFSTMLKPELIMEIFGETARKFLYGTIERAAEREAVMSGEMIERMKKLMSVYSDKERAAWQDKRYTFLNGEILTKENVLAMALNLGTDSNTRRLLDGFLVDSSAKEIQKEQLLEWMRDVMDERDWDFVQGIWDYLHEYWDDTVRVEMTLNGRHLKPQTASPFSVIVDGKKKTMRGGYYPVKFNAEKSERAGEQELDAAARRNMSGAQVLGLGRGFTKSRTEARIVGRPLKLSLSVIPEHLGQVIHNLTYRLACRDVYRILNDKKLREAVESRLGRPFYKVLKEWGLDSWKTVPQQSNHAGSNIERMLHYIRSSTSTAVMGFRMWPAIEGYLSNGFLLMDKIGALNTLSAMGDYYAHMKDYGELLKKSIFMQQRIENMDRDLKRHYNMMEVQGKIPQWLKEHQYWLMEKGDLMYSAPLWCRVFKDSFEGCLTDVLNENKKVASDIEAAQAEIDALKAALHESRNRQEELRIELDNRRYGVPPTAENTYASMDNGLLQYSISEEDDKQKEIKRSIWEVNQRLELLAERRQLTPEEVNKEAEKRAIFAADKAVRETIGSGHVKDLPSIMKGGEFNKMFTMFYGFFATQANAIVQSYYHGKATAEGVAAWAPVARSALYRIILVAAIGTLGRMVLLGEGDDDKDKKQKDAEGNEVEIPLYQRVLKQLAKNTLSTAFGTMYGVREFANFIINMEFEGTDYGRGISVGGISAKALDSIAMAYKLAGSKGEKDEKARLAEEKRKARYDKMTPKQKRKFDEEQKYRKPPATVGYIDIAKSLGMAATDLTAAKTGVTETMTNAVFTTMQYLLDDDGRYDRSLQKMIWSAFWAKKPVKREIPERPKEEKKNRRNRRDSR